MPHAYTNMAHRKYVSATSWIATILRKRSTWHYDAWLLLTDAGVLWLRTETSEGGIRGLALNWYEVIPDGELRREAHYPRWPDDAKCTMITLSNTRLIERAGYNAAVLNWSHWQRVLPMIVRPRGYKWSSVALHYIETPSLDPFEGCENWHHYTYTGPEAKPSPPKPVTKGQRVQAPAFMRPLAALDGLL